LSLPSFTGLDDADPDSAAPGHHRPHVLGAPIEPHAWLGVGEFTGGPWRPFRKPLEATRARVLFNTLLGQKYRKDCFHGDFKGIRSINSCYQEPATFTWVFNHTRGSLFIAILLHASINTSVALVPLFPVRIVIGTGLASLIGFGVPALLIVILTRGRLGYQPSQEQPLRPGEIEAQPTP
jgi:hypothetical protein